MTFKWITYTVSKRTAFITLDRPEKRNALSPGMVAELQQAFTQAGADPKVKVIVLKANGKAFSAGADLGYLQELQQYGPEENLADSNRLKELFHKIYTLPKVVLAQVEGPAIAGGCGLATVCDFVFATSDSRFGYSEVRIGFVPAIVMTFLLRKVGEARAKELMLTGTPISAERALDIGIVQYIESPLAIGEKVADFAQMLAQQCSGSAMTRTKQMMAEIQGMPLNEALDFAAHQNAEARATDDCKQGIAAFLNKEEIVW